MTQINLMALRHSAFYSPYLMTIAGGYLRDEGLEPRYSLATPEHGVVEAIRAGDCHVAQSAVATSFAALERGETLDIVHFAQINGRDGFFLAARKPDPYFSWDKLVGQRVLVDHFFQPLAMFKYALHRMGVDYAALQVIDAGEVEAMERAFRADAADYVHLQGPLPQQLAHEGIAYVVATLGDAVGPVAFSSLCASRDWLGSDMARAFMRAYHKSVGYVIAAPAEEIAARMHEVGFFITIHRNVLTETINAYQRLGCWEADPMISRHGYENLLRVFRHSGLIQRDHAYELAVVPPPGWGIRAAASGRGAPPAAGD